MYLLGLDLETTGLDLKNDEIIEIGAVVWDIERKAPVRIWNQLVQCSQKIPPEIQDITGISQADVDQFGVPLLEAFSELKKLANNCSYIVAHNGNKFDRVIVEREWSKNPEMKVSLPWIDTMTDLPFPEEVQSRKLTYLAAEHGFLNPFQHRAVFDVLTMLKVLAHYEFNEIEELQKSPSQRIIAQVSFENKDLAKNLGFRWDPSSRTWSIELKEVQVQRMSFPFPIHVEV